MGPVERVEKVETAKEKRTNKQKKCTIRQRQKSNTHLGAQRAHVAGRAIRIRTHWKAVGGEHDGRLAVGRIGAARGANLARVLGARGRCARHRRRRCVRGRRGDATARCVQALNKRQVRIVNIRRPAGKWEHIVERRARLRAIGTGRAHDARRLVVRLHDRIVPRLAHEASVVDVGRRVGRARVALRLVQRWLGHVGAGRADLARVRRRVAIRHLTGFAEHTRRRAGDALVRAGRARCALARAVRRCKVAGRARVALLLHGQEGVRAKRTLHALRETGGRRVRARQAVEARRQTGALGVLPL